MTYPISDVTRRVVYSGSAGAGPYNFTFEILTQTDIAVYKNSTLLTLTTDYTVTINANGTGSITLVSAAISTDRITIVGDRGIQRTTDFVTGGDLFANTLNQELDALTIYSQQVDEKAERGLKAPVTDPTDINMTLPVKASRLGKVLSFDATTGDPIASITANEVSNAQTYAANAANSATAAASSASNASTSATNASNSASAAATSASNASTSASSASTSASSASSSASAASTSASNAATSATNAANSASAASTSASNAATSATNASNSATAAASAQTAAEAARDQALAAYDSFDDRYLGTKTSDPTLDNDGNPLVAGALYFNSVSGIMKLYTGSAWVAAYVSGAASSVSFTPAGNIAATNVQAAVEEVDTEKLAKASNLSDLANAATARTNLGLAIGTDVQAYDAELATLAGMSSSRATYLASTEGFGFRNRIINGDMRIDQRNAGASVTPTSGQYTLDRWFFSVSQTSKLTSQQSTTAPTGFKNSILVTSSSAYTVGASELFLLRQNIEGNNVADLAWGTASAQSVTLSFWVRSSLTGTFGGAIRNSAANRFYPFSYTISSANTFEYKTVTIAGDTSGTWATDNTSGIELIFSLGSGSTVSGTAGSWGSTAYYSATGATSVVGTNGATFYITGVQLEAGSVASPFERRDYGRELILCQRYYQRYTTESAYGVIVGAALCSGATAASGSTQLVVTMRTAPTLSSGGSLNLSDGVSSYAITAIAIAGNQSATRIAQINFTAGGGGLTTYRNYRVEGNNTATAYVDFSSEL